MSRNATVTLPFGDAVYPFRLGIAQMEELQEKCNAGPRVILARIETGAWRTHDIRDTLRLGLVGGGLPAVAALTLIDRYADAGRLTENEKTAALILSAALIGAPDGDGEGEAPGETKGETTTATGSPTAS